MTSSGVQRPTLKAPERPTRMSGVGCATPDGSAPRAGHAGRDNNTITGSAAAARRMRAKIACLTGKGGIPKRVRSEGNIHDTRESPKLRSEPRPTFPFGTDQAVARAAYP